MVMMIPFSECPAKTYQVPGSAEVRAGRDVMNHCLIVGEVSRALMGLFPQAMREALFPPGADLLAACHDIGKVCPTFYDKICAHYKPETVNFKSVSPLDYKLGKR